MGLTLPKIWSTTTPEAVTAGDLNANFAAVADQLAASPVEKVATVADLKALTDHPDLYTVIVQGYDAVGDGGDGPFYADIGDTTSADNGGTILVGDDGARWKRLNTPVDGYSVAHFGVLPRNTAATNTTRLNAMLAALDAGHKIYFSAGIYEFNARINVPDYTHFVGSGNNLGDPIGTPVTTLKFAGTSADDTIFLVLGANWQGDDIEIRGAENNDASSVYLTGVVGISTSTSLTTNNVRVMGFETLIQQNGGYYTKIQGGELRNANRIFYGQDPNNLVFDRVKFDQYNQLLKTDLAAAPVTFTDCSIEEWTEYLIDCAANSQITLKGCYVEENIGATIPPGLTNAGSTFSAASGIIFRDGQTVTLIGNLLNVHGCSRFVNGTSRTTSGGTLFAIGNRILKDDGTSSDYIFFLGEPLDSGLFANTRAIVSANYLDQTGYGDSSGDVLTVDAADSNFARTSLGSLAASAYAASDITPGPSPYTYTNTSAYPQNVVVRGGTVSSITFSRDGSNFFSVGATSGMFYVPPGCSLQITYSVVPVGKVIPL